MIFYGLLRLPARWLFQLPGTPAARLLLAESPRVGKLIVPYILPYYPDLSSISYLITFCHWNEEYLEVHSPEMSRSA